MKPHAIRPTYEPPAQSTLMTDDQFENFWMMLLARGADRHPKAPTSGPLTVAPRSPGDTSREDPSQTKARDDPQRGRSTKPTLQRCGTCRGCTASDCGGCKNCRDKTKFGGPGIKKKACLRRVCHTLKNRDGDEDDSDEEDAEVADSPSLPSTTGHPLPPHGARAGFGSSSVDSQPQSEMTSPRARPSSPPNGPPHLSIGDGVCDVRQPLEDLVAASLDA